jgi:hypothetical protein
MTLCGISCHRFRGPKWDDIAPETRYNRENTRFREHIMRLNTFLTALLGGVLGAGLFSAMTTSSPPADAQENPGKVIAATEFQVVDNQGAPRIRLTTNEGEPVIFLLDKAGASRMQLQVLGDNPFLTLFRGQETRMILTDEPGGSAVRLFHQTEQRQETVQLLAQQTAAGLVATDGTYSTEISVRPDDQLARVFTSDANGSAQLYANNGGSNLVLMTGETVSFDAAKRSEEIVTQEIRIVDDAHNDRIVMGVRNNDPRMSFYDQSHRLRLLYGVVGETPSIYLYPDGTGSGALSLRLRDDEPYLRLTQGKANTTMTISEGVSSIRIKDTEGTEVWSTDR